MNTRTKIEKKDFLFLFIATAFFFGCIASSHRSAKTLEPGQFSFDGSYLRADNIENSAKDPLQLAAVDMRCGAFKGMDFGIAHTFDISENSDGEANTIWGDFKVQTTNLENELYKPIFSFGIIKGYAYHEKVQTHISSLPLMVSVPLSEYVTPTLTYRLEYLDENFIPKFKNPRNSILIGCEFNLIKPEPQKWAPKLGLSAGFMNSILGGEGDHALIFNLGFSYDSPLVR